VTKNRFVQASKRTGNSASKKIATDSARTQQQQQQQLCGNSKHEQRTKSLREHQLQQQAQQQVQAPIEGSRSQTSERSNIVSGASFVSVGEDSPMELENSSQSTY
jgi:hypothetical protein